MKSIILSCTPAECEKIVNGDMSILVRKKVPKETPFKVYIYCAKSDKYLLDRDSDGSMFCWDKKEHHYPFKYEKDHEELFNGKVIGSFVCDKVDKYTFSHYEAEYRVTHVEQDAMCLNQPELIRYGKGNTLYGWHISDLKIYDKPKELSEFCCHDNTYDNAFGWAFEDRAKSAPLTRPPQSWQYVEEIGE